MSGSSNWRQSGWKSSSDVAVAAAADVADDTIDCGDLSVGCRQAYDWRRQSEAAELLQPPPLKMVKYDSCQRLPDDSEHLWNGNANEIAKDCSDFWGAVVWVSHSDSECCCRNESEQLLAVVAAAAANACWSHKADDEAPSS